MLISLYKFKIYQHNTIILNLYHILMYSIKGRIYLFIHSYQFQENYSLIMKIHQIKKVVR